MPAFKNNIARRADIRAKPDRSVGSLTHLEGLWMTMLPNTCIVHMLENVHIFLLSSGPFKFTEDHIGEFREMFKLPRKIVRMIDGEMAPWYGSRTIQGLNYLWPATTVTK